MPLDDTQSLHPTLARLAADYDRIVERWARQEITSREARASITSLVGRDDEGVLWSIDPDTAEWRYRDISGAWRPGSPPAYGYPSPNPHTISHPSGMPTPDNPDNRLLFRPVDEDLLHAPTSLIGSTRRHTFRPDSTSMAGWWRRAFAILVVVICLVAIGVAAYLVSNSSNSGPGSPHSTPATGISSAGSVVPSGTSS